MCSLLIDYSSPETIKEFLKDSNFAMQKKWGQNFLIDSKMRDRLIEMLGDIEGKSIWEVGPGLGAITHLLAKRNVKLTLFEIDAGFISFLKDNFEENSKNKNDEENNEKSSINIIEGDVLKTWKSEKERRGMPDIFFGCLPYNITSDLFFSLFKKLAIFDKMLVTVQQEVSQKMLAKENMKEYAPLSVLTNYFYECKMTHSIPPSCFWPQPKVTSTAVLLTKKGMRKCNNEALFVRLVFALFSSRRRTIKNNLNGMLKQQNLLNGAFNIDDFFSSLHVDSSARAEDLSVADFVKIANMLDKKDVYQKQKI